MTASVCWYGCATELEREGVIAVQAARIPCLVEHRSCTGCVCSVQLKQQAVTRFMSPSLFRPICVIKESL